MKQQSLFTKERLVYWPEAFGEVVEQLTGRAPDGRTLGNGLYGFNTGAIVLAASLGVQQGRRRDVGPLRKEISTSTFASHRLELYLFLIPLLGDSNLTVDALRPENEELIIREFERYAAGGLEFLSGVLEETAGKSIDMVVASLSSSLRRDLEPETGLPNLLA